MKAYLLLFSLFFVVCLTGPADDALRLFHDFKFTFNRQYFSHAEETKKFGCFVKTLAAIEKLNQIDNATHGVNRFADMCQEEFKIYHNMKVSNESVPRELHFSAEELAATPNSFDWRAHGVLTGVKNQKQCGSCWAFSTVASLESAWKLAGNSLTSLSEEMLVQCAKSAGQGCDGGDMPAAIKWVISNHGINSDTAYPYTSGEGITGSCNTSLASVAVAKFSTLIQVPQNEAQIATYLVKYGPLSIGVDASDGWQTYTGGIKTTCGFSELDHGVSLVGYTTDYWIVRNSWGAAWGEGGYIRLKRGVNCNGMANLVNAVKV